MMWFKCLNPSWVTCVSPRKAASMLYNLKTLKPSGIPKLPSFLKSNNPANEEKLKRSFLRFSYQAQTWNRQTRKSAYMVVFHGMFVLDKHKQSYSSNNIKWDHGFSSIEQFLFCSDSKTLTIYNFNNLSIRCTCDISNL